MKHSRPPTPKKERVKFISYDGRYPNLCSGILILEADGKRYEFAPHSLSSGGGTYFTNGYQDNYVEEGDWAISQFPVDFPPELEDEAVRVLNDNVSQGCCGGCL